MLIIWLICKSIFNSKSFAVPELSNSYYGSVCLVNDQSINQQSKALQSNFVDFFEEIAALSKTDVVNATHQARKLLKSYRAFVKLMRACPDVSEWKAANYLLRDLGKEFSDMRDAHVREMLLTELNNSLQLSFLQTLVSENRDIIKAKEKILLRQPNHFNKLSRHIKESNLLNNLFKKAHPQEKCVIESLRIAYHKSLSAYLESNNLKTEEAFHEWRKRLKDLLNQLKFFRPEEDLRSDERFTLIDSLCEEMGMMNDMAMLKDWIEKLESSPPLNSESAGMVSFLEKKISGFQQKLVNNGNSFYKYPDKVLHNLERLIRHE